MRKRIDRIATTANNTAHDKAKIAKTAHDKAKTGRAAHDDAHAAIADNAGK